MRILLNGACGKMGKAILACAQKDDEITLAAAVDPFFSETDETHLHSLPDADIGADVLIDFSHHTSTGAVADYAEKFGIPVVLCTTGQTEEELCRIQALAAKVPVFFSANMSMGVALLVELAKTSAAVLPNADIEIIEKHHSAKLDAPSGTALMLAQAIKSVRAGLTMALGRSGRRAREKDEIGIHAVRAGSIVGEHEVILATENEIVTIRHAAQSRSVFADGAIAAAKWLIGRDAGCYNMQNMIAK